MTMKTWALLRVLFLAPAGGVLALLVIYRHDGVLWWILALMLVQTVAVLWLLWMRWSGKVRVDRG